MLRQCNQIYIQGFEIIEINPPQITFSYATISPQIIYVAIAWDLGIMANQLITIRTIEAAKPCSDRDVYT